MTDRRNAPEFPKVKSPTRNVGVSVGGGILRFGTFASEGKRSGRSLGAGLYLAALPYDGELELMLDEPKPWKAQPEPPDIERTLTIDGSASSAARPTTDRKFTKIGNYRTVRLLGEGGMGAVYEAEQDQPRRKVAIKEARKRSFPPHECRGCHRKEGPQDFRANLGYGADEIWGSRV